MPLAAWANTNNIRRVFIINCYFVNILVSNWYNKVVRIKPLKIHQSGKRSLEKGNGDLGEEKEQAELENGNWEVEYKCLETDIVSKVYFKSRW